MSDIFTNNLGPSFNSARILTDESMVETVADWSKVRSPSRALRRLRRGFKQNIVYRQVPLQTVYVVGDTYVMHPEVAKALETITVDQQVKETP